MRHRRRRRRTPSSISPRCGRATPSIFDSQLLEPGAGPRRRADDRRARSGRLRDVVCTFPASTMVLKRSSLQPAGPGPTSSVDRRRDRVRTNMTTLTMASSRAVIGSLRPGDRIILTRIDHDANDAPSLLAAADADIEVDWLDIDPDRSASASVPSPPWSGQRPSVVHLRFFECIWDRHRPRRSGRGARRNRCAPMWMPFASCRTSASMLHRLASTPSCARATSSMGPCRNAVAAEGLARRVGALQGSACSLGSAWRVRDRDCVFPLLRVSTAAVDHLSSARRALAGQSDWTLHSRDQGARGVARRPFLVDPALRHGVGSPVIDGRVATFAISVQRSHGERGCRRSRLTASPSRPAITTRRAHAAVGLLESRGLVRNGFVDATTTGEVDRLVERLFVL